jgi:hypothetical protein
VVLAGAALYAVLRWAAYTPLRQASLEAIVWGARRDSHFLETLRGMKTIKLFNAQDARRSQWLNLLVQTVNRQITTQKLGLVFRSANALLVGVIAIVVVWLAGIFASAVPLIVTGIAILGFLIFAAAFVLPVWLLASFALVPTISTIEDAGPFSAMGRSLRLIAGSRWRIIGVMVLLFIIEIILSALLGAIFLGAFLTESTAGRVAAVLVGAAGTIAWEPLPWAALALFYYDMRIRKEAFDLQLAAEALPSTG